MFYFPPGTRHFQKIAEIKPHPIAGSIPLLLNGDIPCADEDIGVVPVYEHFFHSNLPDT